MTGQQHGSGDGRFHRARPLHPQQGPPPPPPQQGPPPPPQQGPPSSPPAPPPPRRQPPSPPQRIPVPQLTADEQERAREEHKREAKRLHEQARKEADVPRWGSDVLRVCGCSVTGAVFAWVLILLVRWRILQDNTYDTVENTDIWAGIVAMLVPLMLPFLLLAPKRPDQGFRYGAVPFLPVTAVVAGTVQSVCMFVWPWLVGEDLVPGTVLAELASDPIAMVTAAALVFTWTCVFLVVVASMMSSLMGMNVVVGLILVLPFLGAILGAGYASVRTFDGPPSLTACLVWVGAGFFALIFLTAVDALRNHVRSRS